MENSESESGSDDIIKQTNEFVQATEEEWESKNPGIAKEWERRSDLGGSLLTTLAMKRLACTATGTNAVSSL